MSLYSVSKLILAMKNLSSRYFNRFLWIFLQGKSREK